MTKRCRVLGCLAGMVLALSPVAAFACRVGSNLTPYLHPWLPAQPALSADMIAAEVEILSDPSSLGVGGIDARVITMLRGDYAGKRLRIEPEVVTSCDAIPTAGARGVVIGKVLREEDGVLVIDIVRAPSLAEQRLKGGGLAVTGPDPALTTVPRRPSGGLSPHR